MKRYLAWPVPVVAVTLVLAGCSGDNVGAKQSSANSTTATSAAAAPNPLLEQAATGYKEWAITEVDKLVGLVKTFTDAVRAGDLKAAQAGYAPSRVPWEAIEPLAELVSDIDGAIDSRVDDFSGADDPKFTGWHRLEYLLFEKNTTQGGAAFADGLDKGVAQLKTEIAALTVEPINVAKGSGELIEEVSQGKITGEEDRYSKTDLWDFGANLQGSQAAITQLTPALQKADPALLGKINAGFTEINATLAPLKKGDGWVLFCTEGSEFPSPLCPAVTVTPQVVDTLKAQLASLSENLAKVPGALGLQ